jgi:oligopeptide transport system permease protein
MGRYALRRLIQLIPVFLGATFLIYALVWALPGDPLAGKCGERPCPQAYIQVMRARYNLNDPLPIQYVKYLGHLLRGDFGIDFSGRNVIDTMAQAWPITARLALVALLFEAVIGLGAGLLTGLRRGGYLDNIVLISTLILIAVPIFVFGYGLQYFLGIKLGIMRPTVSAQAPFNELILPGLVLASGQLAYMARLSRASLVENMRSDYMRTATAKGLKRRRVIGVHLLRNSLIPVITLLGLDLGGLMGGAVITEGIFNIPGVGGTLYQAIIRTEGATVVAFVTVLVVIYLVVNLLVDLLYAVLDPRIRYV